MKLINNQRTFISNYKIMDNRGYVQVIDINSKVKFFLPKHVIEKYHFKFSWDTYKSDLEENEKRKSETKQVLEKELNRLKNTVPASESIKIGIVHLTEMLDNF